MITLKVSLIAVAALTLTACSSGGLPDTSVNHGSTAASTSPTGVTVGGDPSTFGSLNSGISGSPSGTSSAATTSSGGVSATAVTSGCDPRVFESPTSNEEFLRLAYCTFYNRTPDSAGYNYWMANLNQGYARLNVLLSFQLSSETEGDYGLSSASPSGIVTFLYKVYLNRAPDAAGLSYWVNTYVSLNGDKIQTTRAFLNTPEPKVFWSL